MKKMVTMVLAVCFVIAFASVMMAAEWDKCTACHKAGDKPAMSKETLLKKHKTADAFIKAGKTNTNPMMNAFKNDAMLSGAAKELYK
ncbi:MAG: hypothetical protein RBT37_09420 [Dissulfurispiraceae bacterium]|jgi:hypothetical protein|nr:hypothetical protein [Dissulfurispiraceae bacterium]